MRRINQMGLYADDIVFNSPVTAVQFTGKAEVGALMAEVLAGFERWERTYLFADEDPCVFGARGRQLLHRPGPARTAAARSSMRASPDGAAWAAAAPRAGFFACPAAGHR
jgi:hypothetical protein